MTLVTLWWLTFFTAVGLCLGSFLNVVIYRLPMGLAITEPRWSFCPHCYNRVAWYDNLPVFSYFLLRGRCRNCWSPIASRYPIVEMMSALIVLALLDAIVFQQVRGGLHARPDVNWRLSEDWPILLAHIILFASLLAMSAIDLQFYWVDIRFTHFATVAGIVLHTIWTPASEIDWPRPSGVTAATCMVAFVSFVLVWFFLIHPPPNDGPDDSDERSGQDAVASSESPRIDADDHSTEQVLPDAWSARANDKATLAPSAVSLTIFIVIWIIMALSLTSAGFDMTFHARSTMILLALLAILLFQAAQSRGADLEIAEAIESEAPDARRMTMRELAGLSPALVLGGLTLTLILSNSAIATAFDRAIHWNPKHGEWQPIWGLSTAISGYIIAATLGWSVRILANLSFGREAFALGDIHMMAAAGAVAGWPVAILGFVITCFVAILGWVVLLPFKKSRVIPFGPWLTIGFLITTLFYRDIVQSPVVTRIVDTTRMLISDN